MRPLRLLLAVALAALAGCVPSNHLDWKISAKTLDHYDEWRADDFARFSPELRKEVNWALALISTQTPGLREKKTDRSNNAFCRRIHGRTLRSVLIEAYGFQSAGLHARISTTQDNLLRNAELSKRIASDDQQLEFDRVRRKQIEAIAAMEAEIAFIKQRVDALAGPAK
jgi:hypothetical protein